jgi:hypothetical protein
MKTGPLPRLVSYYNRRFQVSCLYGAKIRMLHNTEKTGKSGEESRRQRWNEEKNGRILACCATCVDKAYKRYLKASLHHEIGYSDVRRVVTCLCYM